MAIYAFDGAIPFVHETAFVHPQASVTGHVVIGRDCYVGPGAALRGDWGSIELGEGCNVQESCTIHMFPGTHVVLEPGAHVGHGAVIHGARLGANCLVGMNAVVMDRATIGAGSVVGALAFVPEGMAIPPRSIAVGNPARVVKAVSDEMLAWKTEGTALYQALPAAMRATWREVEPLRTVPPDRRPPTPTGLVPWGERSGRGGARQGGDGGDGTSGAA